MSFKTEVLSACMPILMFSFDRTTTEIDFLVLALRDLTDFAKLDINRRRLMLYIIIMY